MLRPDVLDQLSLSRSTQLGVWKHNLAHQQASPDQAVWEAIRDMEWEFHPASALRTVEARCQFHLQHETVPQLGVEFPSLVPHWYKYCPPINCR